MWNEIIGFLFVVFALSAGWYCVRAGLDANPDASTVIRMLMSGIFFVVMLYYGISSFRKARRISRS